MARALFIIDVQNDFTSRAGSEVAQHISDYAAANRADYDYIVASRDWHDGDNDNGGHFPPAPGGSALPWLTHCVADSAGAQYDPRLNTALIDVHVKKGQGFPGYSLWEGTGDGDEPFPQIARRLDITEIDVVGIATEYCVAAAAQDGAIAGVHSRVLLDLCRGFSATRIAERMAELRELGVEVVGEAVAA
jgi:nicotinamidase/pyrazinamidase